MIEIDLTPGQLFEWSENLLSILSIEIIEWSEI